MAKPRKKRVATPLRVEGATTDLRRTGPSMRCIQTRPLVGASTNQGYIHICIQCAVVGRNATRDVPITDDQRKREQEWIDAMAHRVPGSFESGKRR